MCIVEKGDLSDERVLRLELPQGVVSEESYIIIYLINQVLFYSERSFSEVTYRIVFWGVGLEKKVLKYLKE